MPHVFFYFKAALGNLLNLLFIIKINNKNFTVLFFVKTRNGCETVPNFFFKERGFFFLEDSKIATFFNIYITHNEAILSSYFFAEEKDFFNFLCEYNFVGAIEYFYLQ